ncbi:semialdehyde dehydrogenase [Gorgonomyces haynaldii]|nr:semialdehyde dehydrogenase [Gorgonomyces haynaldii]
MSIPVGVLGATGTVGQRFIQLLETHPLFYVHAVGASERSSGKTYEEATNWKMTTPIPEKQRSLIVQECNPAYFEGCKIIFSGLDASVAGDVEMEFLLKDFVVFSNAKNHRMNPLVPLMVPLVNPDHFDIIPHQRKHFKLNKGFLVTNANCSTTGLVVALKALEDKFGPLAKINVVTMQAISGAGYPGVPSLDILGNVVPFISGEEEKIEIEVKKILSKLNNDQTGFVEDNEIRVSASCNRVPVIDGHTESVFVEFRDKRVTPEEAKQCFEGYSCEATQLKTFSAPQQSIIVLEQKDRPQPRLDLMLGNGNAVAVGRIRKCNIFDLKFTLLCHNTILGAAGSSIMNAEIAVARGIIN